MASETITADELRKNDRDLTDVNGNVTGSVETYILKVLPRDLLTTLRGVALLELRNQEVDEDNHASQIIVDNLPASKRSIDRAMRRVQIRFQDNEQLLAAVKDIYELLQKITRIQSPPKNAIVARQNFYLFINTTNMGLMPNALVKLKSDAIPPGAVLRVVGPLVPYGRKLFWNPVGTSSQMKFKRVRSRRSATGFRFMMPMRGASLLAPRFKPYAPSTMKKIARKSKDAASALNRMFSGLAPPGRTENAGQIVKRVMKQRQQYRGLHFSDGWIEYPPAIGWSRLRDARVPAMGVMQSKKGALPGGGLF